MKLKIPCKECISYAICRSNLIEYIEDYINTIRNGSYGDIREELYIHGAIINTLMIKCCKVYNYLYYTGQSSDEFIYNVGKELDVDLIQYKKLIREEVLKQMKVRNSSY